MQSKTKSLLAELQSMSTPKDMNHLIESRANNVISSAINLLDLIDSHYDKETAELLEKKLLTAIRSRDMTRFAKSLKSLKRKI